MQGSGNPCRPDATPRGALESKSVPSKTAALLAALAIVCACDPPVQQPALPAAPNLASLPQKAAEAVRDAHEKFLAAPSDGDRAGRLAMLLHAYEQYEAAERFYLYAEKHVSGPNPWPHLAGYVQQQQGKTEEADASYRRAISFDPTYVAARLRLAALLETKGDLDEAEELYRAALELAPDSAHAHYGLGTIAAARSDDAEAAERFRLALASAPEFTPPRYALSQALARLGDEEAAKREAAAAEQSPRVAEVMFDPVLLEVEALLPADAPQLLARGKSYDEQGMPERAIEQYLLALDQDPDYAEAHVNLMTAYGALGRLEEAERSYEAAARLGADMAELHYNLGVLRSFQGRLEEAERAFRAAITRDPGMADAHANLGFILEQTGRAAAADRSYRRALEIQPNHRLALYHRGRRLLEAGQAEQALPYLQQAAQVVDERSGQILYTLARAQATLGRVGEARGSLQNAYAVAQQTGQSELMQAIQEAMTALGG